MMDRTPNVVSWGPMDKRNIGFFVHIAGRPTSALFNRWEEDMRRDPDAQSLIYSNSAKACDETLMSMLESRREKLPIKVIHTTKGELKVFVALTGECGLMMKSYLMAAFCGDDILDAVFELPTVWAMPVTSAAQCGLSSRKCKRCYRYGPCPNWHDLMQEMGRVARDIMVESGSNEYRTFLT